MASAKKKKHSALFVVLIALLCLVLICAVSAAVFLGRLNRKVKAVQTGATFDFSYQISLTGSEAPAFYQILQQANATQGTVSGQYASSALQLSLCPQNSSKPLTRLYISPDETLYDVRQIYETLRSSITDSYPLASILLPSWSLGDYISQQQLASVLGVDSSTVALQDVTGFSLDLKKLQKVQPENALDGYLYFQLEADSANPDAPTLIFGVQKKSIFDQTTPLHILLTIPEHQTRIELTGTLTTAQTTVRAPSSRMNDEDIATLTQLRETIESVIQFVKNLG